MRDIHSVDLLTPATEQSGLSLTAYRRLIKSLIRSNNPRRNYCSAVGKERSDDAQDYFVFSRSTPLSVFGDFVLGRNYIDNYLLSRLGACNGSLVDTTFACLRWEEGVRNSACVPSGI